MKKLLIISLLLSQVSYADCVVYTCDASIIYAMTKEREAIRKRLNDMINTLEETTKETDINNAVMTKEALEYIRIRERYKLRLRDAKKQGFRLENIAHMVDLGVSLQAIKAEVILNANTDIKHHEKGSDNDK